MPLVGAELLSDLSNAQRVGVKGAQLGRLRMQELSNTGLLLWACS